VHNDIDIYWQKIWGGVYNVDGENQ